MEKLNKKAILKQHQYAISQYSDGRWKTYVDIVVDGKIKRKQIAKATKKEVEDEVVKVLKETTRKILHQCQTLNEVFKEWILWRKSCGVYDRTLHRNKNDWDKFVLDSMMGNLLISEITPDIVEDFFFSITTDHQITQKRFSDFRGILIAVFKYAIRQHIISENPVLEVDVDILKGRFKPSKKDLKEVYTAEDRDRILKYLEKKNDPYSLAISLAFCISVRVGELTALKKSDVHDNMLLIQRAQRGVRTMNDDLTFNAIEYTFEERIKGNMSTGFRSIPLSSKAQEIVRRIKDASPATQEFMFVNQYGKPIIHNLFNRHLKRVCEDLHIKYKPSHQIRFSVATLLSENGVPLNQLSVLLGHSEVRTTLHYIRQRQADEQSIEIINKVLA